MDKEIFDHSIVVVAADQVSGDLTDGEVAILNLKDGVYYGLNTVGSRIWSLIQQPRVVREVCDMLLEEYEVDPDTCSKELLALLKDLAEKNMIDVKDELNHKVSGSRPR